MRTKKRTYYVKKERRVTQVDRFVFDAPDGIIMTVPVEPVFFQRPFVATAILWGYDGNPHHSAEIDYLTRYTWMAGHYICIVTEAGSKKQSVFRIMDVTNWRKELDFEVRCWLGDLYTASPEPYEVRPPQEDPPPPDEIPFDGGSLNRLSNRRS